MTVISFRGFFFAVRRRRHDAAGVFLRLGRPWRLRSERQGRRFRRARLWRLGAARVAPLVSSFVDVMGGRHDGPTAAATAARVLLYLPSLRRHLVARYGANCRVRPSRLEEDVFERNWGCPCHLPVISLFGAIYSPVMLKKSPCYLHYDRALIFGEGTEIIMLFATQLGANARFFPVFWPITDPMRVDGGRTW